MENNKQQWIWLVSARWGECDEYTCENEDVAWDALRTYFEDSECDGEVDIQPVFRKLRVSNFRWVCPDHGTTLEKTENGYFCNRCKADGYDGFVDEVEPVYSLVKPEDYEDNPDEVYTPKPIVPSENERLRKILVETVEALGTTATVSQDSCIEFLESIPKEVAITLRNAREKRQPNAFEEMTYRMYADGRVLREDEFEEADNSEPYYDDFNILHVTGELIEAIIEDYQL